MSALVAVLAGGRGRRMGGRKPLADLDGAPLIARPLAAAASAGLETVVVAKADTPLPPLTVPVWREPDEPVHPLLGIVTALERAQRPVVAVGCDMPFVTPEIFAELATGPAALCVDGDLMPLPARYEPDALPALRAALQREASLRVTLRALSPTTRDLDDPRVVASVNTPEELAAARGA